MLQKSEDSLKACFENLNINKSYAKTEILPIAVWS